MTKSNEQGKEAKEKAQIKFSKKFYSNEAIKKAAIDYKNIAEISLEEDESTITATITPKEDIKNISKEFSNYVLGLIVNQG